jgi:hypothetical protein
MAKDGFFYEYLLTRLSEKSLKITWSEEIYLFKNIIYRVKSYMLLGIGM